MNKTDFESLVSSSSFSGEDLESAFEETHISWLAFSKSYAFKIKKPVKLTFLDFSSLPLRLKYCQRELNLNQRFSSIYLGVLPVREGIKGWFLGEGEGDIKDYAVWMKRMDSSKRMDKMLHANKVGLEEIRSLAGEIASFHETAQRIEKPFDYMESQNLFNDITSVSKVIKEQLGDDFAVMLSNAMRWSDDYLKVHQSHIQQRIDRGCQRDLHGDLHAGNIFLYTSPILFDCIEFNDEFRQIDLLYEIAFLCMELEADGHEDLSHQFLSIYAGLIPTLTSKEDFSLYNYYKALRANIRAKVAAIRLTNSDDPQGSAYDLSRLENYLKLMQKYMLADPAV